MNLPAKHESHPELELIQALTGEGKTNLTTEAMRLLAELDEFLTPPAYEQLKD